MKKLIALLLSAVLFMMTAGCTGGSTEPTEEETTSAKTETTEATAATTLPQQTEGTEPVEPEKVTVYLLERTSIFDYGYQVYSYDENYNIIGIDTFTLENVLAYKLHFNKQDANGMFCERVEEWDGDSYVSAYIWSQDGELREEQYAPNFSGDRYAYDAAGNMTQMQNYYDGALNYTVYFEYSGNTLQRAYCESEKGYKLFECKIDGGRIVEKDCFDMAGIQYCAYTYKYDNNGNLEQIRFVMDGEDSPCDTHSYRAVEVDADRAPYLIAQQQYLLDIKHAG